MEKVVMKGKKKTTLTMMSTLPTIKEQEAKQCWNRRARLLTTKTADACLDWVIFPSLLFVQFGATLYCETYQEEDHQLYSNAVCMLSVALFCAVAGIFRQIVRRHPSLESVVVLLLPEVMTNLLLAWVMIGSLNEAMTLLYWSTGLLVLVGGIAYAHARILRHRGLGDNNKRQLVNPNHYQLLVDKKMTAFEDGDDFEEDEDDENDDDVSDEEWVC